MKWNVEARCKDDDDFIIVCAQFSDFIKAHDYVAEMNACGDNFTYYVVAV